VTIISKGQNINTAGFIGSRMAGHAFYWQQWRVTFNKYMI